MISSATNALAPAGSAAALALLLTAATLTGASSPATAQSGDRDCSDFSTQAQAQAFFKSQGGPASDPHRLDADRDGRACEALPCPCAGEGGSGGGGGGADGVGGAPGKQLRLSGRVTDVVDGDTLDVRSKKRTVRVRLIGIDTPEVFGQSECGGSEASAAMRRIAQGRRVVLRTDPSQDRRDRYGRLLAYVRARGGPSLQVKLLRRGWAKVYVFEDAFRRLARFRRAEAAAQAAGRGAWQMCGSGF